MLVCPHFAITFYPAAYPSTAGPVAMVASTDLIDPASNVAAAVEQMAQREDYLRGDAPDFFARGNRTGSLEWETVRRYATPSGAAAAAMDAETGLPATVGWLRLDLPDEGRAWAIVPAMLGGVSARTRKVGAASLLHLRWTVMRGPASEIATSATDHALLLETGYGILTEDGAEMVLETWTAPEP